MKNNEFRTGRSVVYKNTVHLVFLPKYRRNVFDQKLLGVLREVFTETCEQMDCELVEFGGEDDHVHLIVMVHPKWAIANLVGKLKGKSAYVLRRDHWSHIKKFLWGDHFWSPSYCVVSTGGAALDMVTAYVQNQRAPDA